MSIDTYRIYSIATGAWTGSTPAAHPGTIPAVGAYFDWADTPANDDWDEIPFELAEDEVEYTDADDNRLVIKPPARELKTAVIRNVEAIDRMVFTAYEIGDKVYGIATNATKTTNTWNVSKDHSSKSSLIIEYGGIGYIYFPAVEISVMAPKGSIWSLAKQTVVVEVFGTDSIKAGYEWVVLV